MSKNNGESIGTIMFYLVGIAIMLMCWPAAVINKNESKRKGNYQDASMCKYTGDGHRYCERYAGGKEFCTYESDGMAVSIDCEIVKNLYKPEEEQ